MPLRLSQTPIYLDCFDNPGRPYPTDADAADTIFQHFAIVTNDIEGAWQRALSAGATPISDAGPVTLPISAGGVTAVKFRDPDGHPLELLQFPYDTSRLSRGGDFIDLDHSAISVTDIDVSVNFYVALGLSEGRRTLNHGPTQAWLDGLPDVAVDVVPLLPHPSRPHLELLGYRQPRGYAHGPLRADDIAATRVLWTASVDGLVRDPDGHLHQLRR